MAGVRNPTAAGLAQLTQFYNTRLGVAEAGGTQTAAWAAYRAGLAEAGVDNVANILDMNTVFGQAKANVAAEANLAAAAPGDVITGDMWAWAPWSGGETDSWLQDRYQIRYEAQVLGPDGETQPVWLQTDWEGTLEGLTAGQLEARALESAQNSLDSGSPRVAAILGAMGDYQLAGIGRRYLMRV